MYVHIQCPCPSTADQLNKLIFTTTEYQTIKRMNAPQVHATTWMNMQTEC